MFDERRGALLKIRAQEKRKIQKLGGIKGLGCRHVRQQGECPASQCDRPGAGQLKAPPKFSDDHLQFLAGFRKPIDEAKPVAFCGRDGFSREHHLIENLARQRPGEVRHDDHWKKANFHLWHRECCGSRGNDRPLLCSKSGINIKKIIIC